MTIYLERSLLDEFESDAIDQQAKLTQQAIATAPPIPDAGAPPPAAPPSRDDWQSAPAQPPAQTDTSSQPPPSLQDLMATAGLASQPSGGAAVDSIPSTAAPGTPPASSGPPALSDLLKTAGLGDAANAVSSAAGNVATAVTSTAPRALSDLMSTAGLAGQQASNAVTQKVDQVQQAVQSVAQPSSRISQFESGLSDADAYAACGPVAAVAFAQAHGRNPTSQEALELAKKVGWSQGQGMAGAASEAALLKEMGIPAHLESDVNWQHVAQDASSANPVIISTPGHYYVVDGYDPQTGRFHEATRAERDLKGGSEWMSADDMQRLMGTANGALYADNPNAPDSSVARAQPSTVTTAGMSGGGATAGQVGDRGMQILSGASQAASWLGDQGQKAVQAVLMTEGGLNNARGDNGKSAGPLQFYEGGQLANFAQQMGMNLDQAKQWVEQNPVAAVQWAIGTPDKPGYLGQAIQRGIQQGLRGPDLATFAQRTGQVSDSPERAGANWNALFGAGQGLVQAAGGAAQGAVQGAQGGAQGLLSNANNLVAQGQGLINNANQGVQSLADYTQQKLAPINAEADRLTAANQQASDQTLQANQTAQDQRSVAASQASMAPMSPVTAPLSTPGAQPQAQSKPIWQQIGDTIAGAISQGLQPLFQGAGNALSNVAGALPDTSAILTPKPGDIGEKVAQGGTLEPADMPRLAWEANTASGRMAADINPIRDVPVAGRIATQALNPMTGGPLGVVAQAGMTAGSAIGGEAARGIARAVGGDETAQSVADAAGSLVGGFAPGAIERAAPAVAGRALEALDVARQPAVAYARTQAPTSIHGVDLSAYPEDIRQGLQDFASQGLAEPEQVRATIAQWVKDNPPPAPPATRAVPRARSADAAPAPLPPAENPFVLANEAPAPDAVPLTADEIADHFDGLNEQHQANDARIADLQAQLEASKSGKRIVHPPGTIGWTNAEVIAYARENGLNPYSEDGWPHMAGDAANIAQHRPRVATSAALSPTAIRQELGQLQQQQSMLMDAASRIANAGPEDTFYRPAPAQSAELPFDAPTGYTEPAANAPAALAPAEPATARPASGAAAGVTAARPAGQPATDVGPAAGAEPAGANSASVASDARPSPVVAQPPTQGTSRQLASTTEMIQQMLDTVRARPDADPATLDALQQQLDQIRGGPRSASPATAAPAMSSEPSVAGAPVEQRVQQALDTAPAPVKEVAAQIGANQDGSRAFDLNALAQLRQQFESRQPPLLQTAQKAPNPLDRFIGYTISNMLWGVGTAVHITTSQALQTLGRPVITAASGHPVDAVRDATAMASSISDAFARFGRTIQTGQRQGLALQAPLAPTAAEQVLQFPLRVHSAINEFYRTLNSAGGAAMEASRRLRENPNLSFQDVLQRYPQDIVDAGAHAAARATFMEGGGAMREIGAYIGKASRDLTNSPDPTQKAAGLVLRWVVPMTHIPAVILGEGIRGLPVVNEVRGVQRAAQLASSGDHYGAQQELGRTALTSFANLAVLNEVAQGNITGDGPTSPAEKARLMEGVDDKGNATWRPNSIRLPDGRWLDYTGLGPIALSMSSIANLVEAAKDYANQPPEKRTGGAPQLAQDLLGREAGTIGQTWFLRGLADVLTAVKEGTVGGTGTQISQAGDRLVPFGALLNEAKNLTDPLARDPQGPLERIQSRLPILSQDIRPRLGATTGQPEEQPHDLASILFRSTPPGMMTPNPVAAEIDRLGTAGNNVSVPYQVKSYKGADQTPEAQQAIRQQVGQAVNQYVLHTISDPRYQGLDDAQKANAISAAVGQAQSAADITLDQQVARSPHDSALLQWSQTPQYAGISSKLPPEEIARQNWEIQQAKAKMSEYRTQYQDQAENRLRRDDPQAYKLAQRDPLDSDVIKRKKAAIDRATGGALSQVDEKAAAGGLVGAGATTLQPNP